MATTRIAFGEWTPDKPGIMGNMTEVKNCYPVSSGYSPFTDKTSIGNAASETLKSTFAGRSSSYVAFFANSDSKIYKFNSSTLNFDNVSKVGGYSGPVTDAVQFGDVVVTANNAEKLQGWTIGVSSAFADLAANAPIAKFVTVVRDFLVCGYQPSAPYRVQWCDINDETNWTSSAASQADYQDVPDGGDIMGLSGGEFGLVFTKSSIHRMSYVGSPLFFQFDNISRGLGCFSSGSIAQYRQLSFFLSDNGFYMCDGQNVNPIGTEKIDRWFFNNIDVNTFDDITANVDPQRKVVIWNFKNTSGTYYQLLYNWEVQRWSYCDIDISSIGGALTAGVTLEQLDNYGTVDSIQISFDSRVWAGGKYFLSGTNGANVYSIDGTVLTPSLITGDVSVDGQRSIVTLARPIIDNGNATVAVASRDKLNGAIAYGSAVTADAENRTSQRSNGKYHRLQVIPTGNWTTAIAVDVELATQGTR